MRSAYMTTRQYYPSEEPGLIYEARVTQRRPFKFIAHAWSSVSMDVARDEAIDLAAELGYEIIKEFKA